MTTLKEYIMMAMNNSCDPSNQGCSRKTIVDHFSIDTGLLKKLSVFKESEINLVIDDLILDGTLTQGPCYGWKQWLVITEKKPGIAKILRIKNEEKLELLLK